TNKQKPSIHYHPASRRQSAVIEPGGGGTRCTTLAKTSCDRSYTDALAQDKIIFFGGKRTQLKTIPQQHTSANIILTNVNVNEVLRHNNKRPFCSSRDPPYIGPVSIEGKESETTHYSTEILADDLADVAI
uniref:Uncharacterized protein n=1 Tax=Anopheles coluzzii TaxID=1518534 RepID=A0A6E8VVZ9_ANOCL